MQPTTPGHPHSSLEKIQSPSAGATLDVEYCHAPYGGDPLSGVLAVVRFGTPAPSLGGGALEIGIQLDPLTGGHPLELWRANGSVRSGQVGAIRYAADDHHLMGIVECEETPQTDIAQAAEFAYAQIRTFQANSEFPHVLRMWNYFDAINDGDGDAERYRRFSQGRARGFASLGRSGYPAASALGKQHHTNLLQVYWIAGRNPGTPVENPRQVSAYHYPREYGPAAPSFARATASPEGALLISGTASIVGHRSEHAGNVAAQLEETLRNLAALKQQAHIDAQRVRSETLLKVYVRHAADAPLIQRSLERLWPASQMVLLAADICRRELLLEIECVVRKTPQANTASPRGVASVG